MRERSFLVSLGQQFLAAVLVGVALGLVGPFGSFEHLTPDRRIPMWVGLLVGNWGLVIVTGELLSRLPATAGWPMPALAAAAGVLGAVPGSLLSYRVAQAFGRFEVLMPSMLVFYGYVAVLSVLVSIPAALIFSRAHAPEPEAESEPDRPAAAPAPQAPPAAPPPAEPPFLARIPPHLGRDLLAVETEDHYLRIHTALGSDLVLMRMRDAVAELAALDGMRVHRSWWVARDAVERTVRNGTALTLMLRGGLSVPVARTQRRTVRAWLGR